MYGIFDFSHDDIAVWGYAEMRLENFVKSTAGNTVNISCPLQTVFYLKMQIDIILGNGDSAVPPPPEAFPPLLSEGLLFRIFSKQAQRV